MRITLVIVGILVALVWQPAVAADPLAPLNNRELVGVALTDDASARPVCNGPCFNGAAISVTGNGSCDSCILAASLAGGDATCYTTNDWKLPCVAVAGLGDASCHWQLTFPVTCAAVAVVGNASAVGPAVAGVGNAQGWHGTVAVIGDATACRTVFQCGPAISGTGNASGMRTVIAVTGDAVDGCRNGNRCMAVSVFGDASSDKAVSVFGDAHASRWGISVFGEAEGRYRADSVCGLAGLCGLDDALLP